MAERLKSFFMNSLIIPLNEQMVNLQQQEQILDNLGQQQMYIDKFNSYYQSKRRNGNNLGALESITFDVDEDNVGSIILNFVNGTIDWFSQANDWVVKYSENGRLSPPDPPLLPSGGPEYILANDRFNGNMPVSVKRVIEETQETNKDPKLGGFRRKKRKRTRRKRCSKKSSKKNKKTFRR